MITLEVCANSVDSALEAQEGGAVRVELCNNLAQGGITPSASQITICRQLIDIELNILIRPREGNFLYNNVEFEIMKQDIHYCGQVGCNGVVFGILDSDGIVDVIRNRELLDIARQYNMSVTFHRAFDYTSDLEDSLEKIIQLGFDRVLTSGGRKTAVKGKENLRKLILLAGENISIMPGGGITEFNIFDLVRYTGLKEFHGSFRRLLDKQMNFVSPFFNDQKEFLISQTDKESVRQAIFNANN